MDGQSPAEVLEMGPVIPVEALAHLGAHIGEEKSVVQSILTPFGIGSRDLVPAVIAGAEIIVKLGAELLRNCFILDEDRVTSISVVGVDRSGCDMFSYPGGILCSSVETRRRGKCRVKVAGRARKPILKDSCRVDWRKEIFPERRRYRDRRRR